MLVDTHCHLNFSAYDKDRSTIIEKARENQITGILCPGVDLKTSQECVDLAERYQEIYAAIGIHPTDLSDWTSEGIKKILDLKTPKVLAIGEIGLDYYRAQNNHKNQQEVFLEQLIIALELDIPVIIHARNANDEGFEVYDDIYQILITWRNSLEKRNSKLFHMPGVFHSFSGNSYWANKYIELGFMIGISGPITYNKASILRNVVEVSPVENLLIETDSPFLTPAPFRGKRNQPDYVHFVAKKIAEIKKMTFESVAQVTTLNSWRLFGWQVI